MTHVQEMLTNPTALAQLGSFLLDARHWQSHKYKDGVMIGPRNTDNMCLVLGVVAQTSQAVHRGSPFGPVFREAAEESEAQVQLYSFDTSVILVCFKSWCSILASCLLCDVICWCLSRLYGSC